jgi:hypothetical protein
VAFSFLWCFADEPAPVAGRQVAGSEESLASSVAFRFPADARCDVVVPRFRVGTAGRFFFPITAVNALKNSGEKFTLDILLMMACCSSCDSGISSANPNDQSNHQSIDNQCLFSDPHKTHKHSPYRAVNTLCLVYKNQSVNAV